MVWVPLGAKNDGATLKAIQKEWNKKPSRNKQFAPIEPVEGLDPLVVELGNKLFHDTMLSRDFTVSCASCHDLQEGGDDGLTESIGIDDQPVGINAPTVFNSHLNIAQFWNGRAATLEEQVDGPIEHPKEMAADWPMIVQRLNGDSDYHERFVRAFGEPPTAEGVRKAIADFERSLTTPNSKFDLWLSGDDSVLGADALQGLQYFQDYGCASCHQGVGVGGNPFQKLGVMRDYFGEHREEREVDLGRYLHTGKEEDKYVFRVPSLRNVRLTAPYFHDGSAETLEEAVRVMLVYQVGTGEPEEEVVRQIALFLLSLTGDQPVDGGAL